MEEFYEIEKLLEKWEKLKETREERGEEYRCIVFL